LGNFHPGVTLREELAARGMSGAALALKLRVPPQRGMAEANGLLFEAWHYGVADEF
jgi:plasmid maintenance system antidote protein VapI